jgi:competence ComEA-like helix-hairpin-helix protein
MNDKRRGSALDDLREGGTAQSRGLLFLIPVALVVGGLLEFLPFDGDATGDVRQIFAFEDVEVLLPVYAAIGCVDLNVATSDDLVRLPGIGPVLAGRIVADRDANGPFASADDLARVSGIGPSTVEGLRLHVCGEGDDQ